MTTMPHTPYTFLTHSILEAGHAVARVNVLMYELEGTARDRQREKCSKMRYL